MRAEQLYEQVTNQLIAEIEAGAGDWEMPWRNLAANGPAKSIDGRRYKGLNSLILGLTTHSEGWSVPVFGTYKTWQRNGNQVAKGEKGTKVILWRKATNKNDAAASSEEEDRGRMFARVFTVFNIDQTDAPPAEQPDDATPTVSGHDEFPQAAEALDALGATILPNSQPQYRPLSDTIGMPDRELFDSESHWLSTLAHENIHRTGHWSRLDRDLENRFGTQALGMEELIAEIGSAFFCSQWGIIDIAKRLDHAEYISGWLQAMRADSRAILAAASKAQRALDYLNESAGIKADEQPIRSQPKASELQVAA